MAFKNLNCTAEVSGLEDTGTDAASERLIEVLESFLLRTLRASAARRSSSFQTSVLD